MSRGWEAKISVRGLWMTFPAKDRSSQDVHVLEDIDLEVREGEFVCIVGPSGCGKSTLLNIGFGVKRATRDERRKLVRHYVEMVGLSGFDRAYPGELSGGMKQRVEIARALAAEPDVLFMDEPFGALDYLTRLRLRHELIQIWQRERRTVLFVTHDVEEAVQLADRIVVMGRRPSHLLAILPVTAGRPRDMDNPVCQLLRDEVFEIMGLDHHGQRIPGSAIL